MHKVCTCFQKRHVAGGRQTWDQTRAIYCKSILTNHMYNKLLTSALISSSILQSVSRGLCHIVIIIWASWSHLIYPLQTVPQCLLGNSADPYGRIDSQDTGMHVQQTTKSTKEDASTDMQLIASSDPSTIMPSIATNGQPSTPAQQPDNALSVSITSRSILQADNRENPKNQPKMRYGVFNAKRGCFTIVNRHRRANHLPLVFLKSTTPPPAFTTPSPVPPPV